MLILLLNMVQEFTNLAFEIQKRIKASVEYDKFKCWTEVEKWPTMYMFKV